MATLLLYSDGMKTPALPTSAMDAARLGVRQYQGKDCPENHGGLRYTLNSSCVECVKEASKRRQEKKKALLAANA